MSLQQQRKFILAIPVTCLVASLFTFGWLQFNTIKAEKQVQQVQQVRLEGQRLLRALLDAETSVRGYALTRRQDFLNYRSVAITEISTSLKQLKQLVADNPSQTQQVQQIDQLANARVNSLQRNLALINSLPANTSIPAELEIRLLEGQGIMGRTRTQIEQFLQEEEQQQRESNQLLRQQQQLTWWVLSLCVGIGVTSSLVAAYLLNRLERKLGQSDRNLYESEARYRAVAENFPNGAILLFDADLRYLLADGMGLADVGLSKEQLEGKTLDQVSPPETYSQLEPLYRDALAGKATTAELPYAGRTYLTYALPMRSQAGDVFAGMIVTQDITERKLSEQQLLCVNRALRTLSECNQAVVRASDEPTLLQEVCRSVVEFGGYPAVWIGYAQQDQAKTVRPVAQAGYQDGYLDSIQITWSDTEQGRGPTGTAIRTGQPSIVQNILTDPNYLPWREAARQRGYAASIALPLIVEGKPLGALNIYAAEAEAFDAAEVRLLTELANDLAYGISALRTQIERQHAQVALRESKQRLDSILNSLEDVVWSVSVTTHEVLYLSPATEKIYGCSAQDFFDHPNLWLELVHPDDVARVSAFNQLTLTQGSIEMEYRIVRPDGEVRWVRDRGRATYDENNTPLRIDGIVTDITARKQTEAALRESEARWQLALRGNNDGIWDWNVKTNEVFFSSRWKEMLGFADHEIANELDEWSKRVHPDDIGWVTQLIQDHFAQKTPFYISEHRVQCKNGTYKWILDRGQALWDEQGNVVRMVGSHTDITDRRQAEKLLRDSEAKFRAFLEAASEAVIVTNPDSEIVIFNAKAEELFGYNRSEVLGRTVEFLMPQRYHDSHIQHRTHYREHPSKRSMGKTRGLFAQRKDGSEFPIAAGLSSIQTQDGTFVMTFLTDITERRQAEDEIKRLNESLERRARETETRYQQIVELAEEGIWVVDRQAKTTYVNQAMARMLGYGESEMVGHPMSDFMSEADKLLATSVKDVGNQHLGEKKEIQLTTKEGQSIWTYMSTSPVLDEQGNLLWSCTLVYDITQRKQAEEQLRESSERISLANAELARATRLKDEFLANMSHELRTPLNAILGLSEALQEEVYGTLTDKQRKSLATIEKSGQHLLDLINDILDLSKIESGKMSLQVTPVSLESLCESSLTFVKQQAHQKMIKLNSNIAPGIGDIEVDERRMRQALVNLLSNAVKFTSEGGEVWLDVNVDAENETLQISVTDTGIGIAPEHLDKLFQPFVQLDSSLTRRYTGTGLGLALVRRIVEFHGGSVSLASEEGKGSQFTLSLPWKNPNPILPNAAESDEEQSELPRLERALVIDDSEPAAKQIARYLMELGTAVTIHSQGDGAIEVVRQIKPDVIILDILLPDRSGWEVLFQLKANPTTRHIPVLVMSVVDERSHGLALGASDYLLKPLSRQQVQTALSKIFALSQLAGNTALPGTPQSEQPSPLILLAEDNEANISTLIDYLQIQEFKVIVARNGLEAVQQAMQQQPDLILMDIQMPEMDGLEATRLIRTHAPTATTPIIALTALAMPGDRERCLAAGANEYVTKPIGLKKLLNLIQEFMNLPNS